ncbi:MAG: hypothetical protein ACQKBY_05840 [Verrucomicrobiales bacterium]
MNISNFQKALRSYANLNQLQPTDDIPGGASRSDVVIGAGSFMETAPVCPSGGTYTYVADRDVVETKIPEIGVVALNCDQPNHAPADTTGW